MEFSSRQELEPLPEDAAFKEDYEEQERKGLRGLLLSTEQFVQNGKLVNAAGIRMNVSSLPHTVIREDESQKNLEKDREIGIPKEEVGDELHFIAKEMKPLAAQPSVLDTHQFCFPSICKHLTTCSSNLNTDPSIREAEQNQQHTNQPKSQSQANSNAAEKETKKNQSDSILAAGSIKASFGALEDIYIPDQIQDLNQNLNLDHTIYRSARYVADSCRDRQLHKLLSLPIFEGNPDATKKKEGSPETTEEPGPPARKKTRTFYSAEQLDELERMFQEDHYPDNEKRREIATAVGVTSQQVMVWFQNRRAKWRKMEKLTLKDNKKSSATEAALLVGSQQNFQGAAFLSEPQLPENMHDQLPAFLMGPSKINCSSIHSEQSAPLVSTSVASVTGRSTSCESGQTKDISQGIFGSLKEEILPAIPSPPPIRRAILPCNVVLNPSSQIVPLMLDTPSNEYSPASQESSSSEAFTYSVQSQSIISPVHCNLSEQLESTTNLENPYYHSSSQSRMFQLSQHPQHQMSQLHHFPIHLSSGMLPNVQLTPATPNKSSTSFFSLPGNGGLVTYGTAEAPPGYLQNHIGGHLLIQPSAGNSVYIPAFQTVSWNEFCMQRAPLGSQLCTQMPLSSSGGGYYSAEHVQITQNQGVPASSCPLQLTKTTVPGATALFTAKQVASADQDLSRVHQPQAEHRAPYEEVPDVENISIDQVNVADFTEDSKN